MKNIKTSEKIILIVLGIIIVLAFIIGLTMDYDKNSEENTINLNVIALNDMNRFITITSAINSYVTSIKYEDIDSLMIILDKKYVEENKINSSNVLDIVGNYNYNYVIDVRESYQIKKYNNIYIYYVRTKLIEENYDSFFQSYIKDLYYKVTLNENTLAFAVAPIKKDEYLNKVGEIDE